MNDFLFLIERVREVVNNHDPTDTKSCSELYSLWEQVVRTENNEVIIEVHKIITQDSLVNALRVIGEIQTDKICPKTI